MTEKLLSEEELDTLLDNVPVTQAQAAEQISDYQVFDFDNQHNLQIEKMSRLSIVRDSFLNEFSSSLFDLYQREVDVSVAYEHTSRFGQYIDALEAPTNINLIYVMPEKKPALIVLDPALLYIMVDQYFGGSGSLKGRKSVRSISPTEWKTAQQIVGFACKDLHKAWQGLADFSFSHTETEDNPENARVYGNNEIVLETVYRVGFDDVMGEMHVILPYSMLESIRQTLEVGAQPEAEESSANEKWQLSLAEQVNTANVRVSGSINGTRLSVEDLVTLKPGDVISIEMPEQVSVNVEGVPTFKGTFGVLNRKHAIQINETYFQDSQRGSHV